MNLKIKNIQPLGFAEKIWTEHGDQLAAIGSGAMVGYNMGGQDFVSSVTGGILGAALLKLNKDQFSKFGGWMSSVILVGLMSKYINTQKVDTHSLKDTARTAVNISITNMKMFSAALVMFTGTMANALFAKKKPQATIEHDNVIAGTNTATTPATFRERMRTEFPRNLRNATKIREYPMRYLFLTACAGRIIMSADGISNLANPEHINTYKDVLKATFLIASLPAAYAVVGDKKDLSLEQSKALAEADKNSKTVYGKITNYVKKYPEKFYLDAATVVCTSLAICGDTIMYAAALQNTRLRNRNANHYGDVKQGPSK